MATAKVQTLQARFLPAANYFCEFYHGVITARKSAGFSRRAMLYIKIVTLHHPCMLFFFRFCSLSVSLGFVNGGMPLFRGPLLSNLYPLDFFFLLWMPTPSSQRGGPAPSSLPSNANSDPARRPTPFSSSSHRHLVLEFFLVNLGVHETKNF